MPLILFKTKEDKFLEQNTFKKFGSYFKIFAMKDRSNLFNSKQKKENVRACHPYQSLLPLSNYQHLPCTKIFAKLSPLQEILLFAHIIKSTLTYGSCEKKFLLFSVTIYWLFKVEIYGCEKKRRSVGKLWTFAYIFLPTKKGASCTVAFYFQLHSKIS